MHVGKKWTIIVFDVHIYRTDWLNPVLDCVDVSYENTLGIFNQALKAKINNKDKLNRSYERSKITIYIQMFGLFINDLKVFQFFFIRINNQQSF